MRYTGLGTAMITPFTADSSMVDHAKLALQTERQVAAGVDFLVPLGTTAETPCLSDEEKVAVLETVRAHAQGLPLVVGAGTNSLQGTLHNMLLLADHGADAFLIVTPYYNKPSQRGLEAYYRAVAAATDKDIILYNVPSRTGVSLEPDTVRRLMEVPNIVGIKEASGQMAKVSDLLRLRDEYCAMDDEKDFVILSGNDEETLALMASGADGVISVVSNVMPEEMVYFVDALLREDMQTARALQARLLPLMRALFIESNPVPVKAAMALIGLGENSLRLPLVPASDATMAQLRSTLENLQ